MRLRELIDALTKLETVCGAATETEATAVGLSIKTVIEYENEYGYSHARTEKRAATHMITISALPLSQPYSIGLGHLPNSGVAP